MVCVGNNGERVVAKENVTIADMGLYTTERILLYVFARTYLMGGLMMLQLRHVRGKHSNVVGKAVVRGRGTEAENASSQSGQGVAEREGGEGGV